MTRKVILYDQNNKKNVELEVDDAIQKLYYQELVFIKDHKDSEIFKKNLAMGRNNIPMYDIYTNNIYIVNKRNVYDRTIYNKYRIPNNELIELFKMKYEEMDERYGEINEDIINNEIKKNLENKEMKKYEDNKKKLLNIRKLLKYRMMIEFIDCFDIDILFTTYVKFFYMSSNFAGKNISVCQRPSFSPQLTHIKPYYTNDEIVNIALNMEIIDHYDETDDNDKLGELCQTVTKNDVNNSIIILHQKYIMESNTMGLVQFYSLQGSWMMNSYLRDQVNYKYKNIFLEKLIENMNKLIVESPPFDKDYTVYRFIKTDEHLRHLKVGDIYEEPGFTSSTRDPFYKPEKYLFGLILTKIKIPKNEKGVALLMEPYSHFHEEQEVLFAPSTKFELISKDSDTIYYHTDPKFTQKIKTRYGFRYVGNNFSMVERPEYEDKQNPIDFLEINRLEIGDIEDKITNFVITLCNPMMQFRIKIGEKYFDIVVDRYDSTDAYKKFYALTTKKGYSLFTIYNNYLLFMIELGDVLHVNYYVRYSITKMSNIMTDEEFLYLISSIGYYFGIENTIIYSEHLTCENQIGSYCLDFYNYLKTGNKRYNNIPQIKNNFLYSELDRLKEIDPDTILKRSDPDELYQIYTKIYKRVSQKYNLAEFYVWLCENNCGSVEIFVKKMLKVYSDDKNPFLYDFFTLNNYQYLYDKRKIQSFPLNLIGNDIIFDINVKKKEELQQNSRRN